MSLQLVVARNDARPHVERAIQCPREKDGMRGRQRVADCAIQCASRTRQVDQHGAIAALKQSRFIVCVKHHDRLQNEFDVQQRAGALLQIEQRRGRSIAFGTPALTHRRDLGANLAGVTTTTQQRIARRAKPSTQMFFAANRARPNERLRFPNPCALALIILERVEADDKQAFGAVRTQTNVDVVKSSGMRLRRQPMHDALRDAGAVT